MKLGVVGRKVGMMRIFEDSGQTVPVTVLEVIPNKVTQIKTIGVDGYAAIQLSYGASRRSVSKPISGHYAKASVAPSVGTCEFRVSDDVLEAYALGGVVSIDIFRIGQRLDVTARSIGKGFSGVIKRHNFSSNRASHGNSRSHNVPGSIGMAQDPGRVFPGKKMSGHLGDVNVTIQNLSVVKIDVARGLLMIKGAVPGAKNAYVIVRPAVKSQKE